MCLTDFIDRRYIHSWFRIFIGWVLSCVVEHILQEFNNLFLTRFRTYKIATPPQTKMISKDDI
jgi:hypothetical protein